MVAYIITGLVAIFGVVFVGVLMEDTLFNRYHEKRFKAEVLDYVLRGGQRRWF